jgi:succinyl-CoA synthetase beta subunit
VLQKLYKCYMDTDASLVEINPLNCDSKGNIKALDAKFNFDSQRAVPPPRNRGLPRSGRRRSG